LKKTIRIGTRDSELALWQANTVQSKLEDLGYSTQLVPVKSEGDLILDIPLYEMGITGIFTKTLDVAMIQGKVDIVVHSMKDVPTSLPKGIVQTAVLQRATSDDILVTNGTIDFEKPCTIATGSLRRKAQWLNRYPNHELVDLRGNVNTRLQKLNDNKWEGAIFAKAGMERLGFISGNQIDSPNFVGPFQNLDWMIPAPAQGAMVVVAMDNDAYCKEASSKLNHRESQICTLIERQFLRTLEGGCSAPIGAFAEIVDNQIVFKGCLFSLDGKTNLEIEKTTPLPGSHDVMNENEFFLGITQFGKDCANKILQSGGTELMRVIKSELT
jgi:hydroxymethylbilane synthase